MKVAYYTLGCKLNFAETSEAGRVLARRGFVRAAEGETPDICVVNTCSVTAEADKKGRQLLRHLHRLYPGAALVATGCYAQLRKEEVAALPGVELVLGSQEKGAMADYIDHWLHTRRKRVEVTPARDIRLFTPSCERGDRTRWFLKVQDGCDCWCTYCTIPMARGRSRSPSIASLVEQARRAAAEGAREIVLTGVNIGDFGKGGSETFFDLARALDQVEGVERYRISSIEPDLLSPRLIEWVAREARAFMPHFHIPLQSGSDAVLRLMRRRYDTALYRERVEMVRSLMPDAFIGVDIMAGARGETEAEWERSLEFVSSLPVQQLHVFPYSERPGTRALELDGAVSPEHKRARVEALLAVSRRNLEAFRARALGQRRPVLWEAPRPGAGAMHGLTDNYLRVSAPLRPEIVNTVTTVILTAENLAAPDGV